MNRSHFEERYQQVRQNLLSHEESPALARPLGSWAAAADRYLPRGVMGMALGEVLKPVTWGRICDSRGIGPGKLHNLLALLERVSSQMGDPSAAPPVPAGPAQPESNGFVEPDHVSDVTWEAWCAAVRGHRLEGETLGRLAKSLAELTQPLWAVTLGEYTRRPLYEIRTMPRHGALRVAQVLAVVGRTAAAVGGVPAEGGLVSRPVPPLVREATAWVEGALSTPAVPTEADLRAGLFAPILEQLAADVGADLVAVLRRRTGYDGPAETLERIANDIGLTRERVRQLGVKTASALRVRWPEGHYLLRGLRSLLRSTPDARAGLTLVRALLDAGYPAD